MNAKQETQGYICPQTKKQCDDECCVSAEDCHIEASFGVISDCEPSKQETLEEAMDRLYNYPGQAGIENKHSFMHGAFWQAERMYSEEDVENILIEYVKTNPTKPYRVISWFGQFKKQNNG